MKTFIILLYFFMVFLVPCTSFAGAGASCAAQDEVECYVNDVFCGTLTVSLQHIDTDQCWSAATNSWYDSPYGCCVPENSSTNSLITECKNAYKEQCFKGVYHPYVRIQWQADPYGGGMCLLGWADSNRVVKGSSCRQWKTQSSKCTILPEQCF